MFQPFLGVRDKNHCEEIWEMKNQPRPGEIELVKQEVILIEFEKRFDP